MSWKKYNKNSGPGLILKHEGPLLASIHGRRYISLL